MATQLIQVVTFTNVAAGAVAALPHNINDTGTPIIPDYVSKDNASFTVVAVTATQITVQNNGAIEATANFWLERKHTIQRAFGAAQTLNLSPRPFIPQDGGPSSTSGTTPRYDKDPGSAVHLEIRYCRPGGSNNNDGLTPATAWADGWTGFKKGIDWFETTSYNLAQRLDITGCTVTLAEELILGGGNIGQGTLDGDLTVGGPSNIFSWATYQIVSEVAPVLDVTITLAVQNSNSKLWVVTVAEALTVNAHIGQNLIGEGAVQWGTIKSNTANTITVATSSNPSTWTGQVGLYTRGASLTFGDPATFFGSAVNFLALGGWFFSGINFNITPGFPYNSIFAQINSYTFFQLCSFESASFVGGSQMAFLDACYIHNGSTLTVDQGAQITVRESVVKNILPLMHGSEQARFAWVHFDNLALPLGSGSLTASRMTPDVDSVAFDNCAQGALIYQFANGRCWNVLIENSVSPIVVTGPGTRTEMQNVGGTTGNTGIGCTIINGAQVSLLGAVPTLSGAGGERKVGGNATGTWVTVPETDVAAIAPQFCRVYT